jgi:hypothetical protein
MPDTFALQRLHGQKATQASGIVNVIDVIRAFAAAANALAGGARRLRLVRTGGDPELCRLQSLRPYSLERLEVGRSQDFISITRTP